MSNNLEKFGIKILENVGVESIKNNPPSSSFVVFNFKEQKDKFYKEILNNEFILEKLPYRLFVVDENSETKNERICVLSNNEFTNKLNKYGPREAVLFLYCKWLKHLIKLNNSEKPKNNSEKFKYDIGIYKAAKRSDTSIPKTVTEKYKWMESFLKTQENVEKQEDPVNLNGNEIEITVKEIQQIGEGNGNNFKDWIIYHRHHIKNINNLKYYEGFSADSVSFPLYFWWPEDDIEKKMRACLLLENSLFSVVVADERICKNSSFTDENKQIKNKLFLLNKFSGDKEVDFKRQSAMPFYLKYENNTWKIKKTEGNSDFSLPKPAILIVHQGVLDKAFNDKTKGNLEKKVAEMKKVFQYVIVTSGRGKPENVPENAKFVLLSDIMINFRKNDYPDKLGILNLIMTLTK